MPGSRPSNNLLQLNLCPTGQDGAGRRGTAGVRCRWHQSATVCAQRPGRPAVTLSTDPGLAGLWRHFLPSPLLAPSAPPPSIRPLQARTCAAGGGAAATPGGTAASGEQALAAQAAGAALIRRAQLAHLVLPNLAHQRVEGVLHALGTRGCSARDSEASGPLPRPRHTPPLPARTQGPRRHLSLSSWRRAGNPGLCPAPV